MKKYYTYKCETYADSNGEVKEVYITVKAEDEKSAWNRLSDYKVSRGNLHYAVLKSVSDTGIEKYYRDEESEKGTALFIGLVGAALGMSQVAQYGQYKPYTNCLKDAQTLYLINTVNKTID